MDKFFCKSSRLTSHNPYRVLSEPITALIGVTSKAAKALNADTLKIVTIRDLASSSIFSLAKRITDATHSSSDSSRVRVSLPVELIDKSVLDMHVEQLVEKPISIFTAISDGQAEALSEELGVATVGDLALWPPYKAALAIMSMAYGVKTDAEVNPEAPDDLIPANGKYPTERVQYEVLLFDKFVGGDADVLSNPKTSKLKIPDKSLNIFESDKWKKIKDILGEKTLRPLGSDGPLDIAEFLALDQGYDRPAIGGVLTFTQSWYGQGLALGTLIHSVALAPGESTKIAMIDWTRKTSAATSESIAESESLFSSIERARAISEITSSVARETQRGESGAETSSTSNQMGIATGTSTYGFHNNDWFSSPGDFLSNLMNDTPQTSTVGTSWGLAISHSKSSSYSNTSGERDIAAQMAQNIMDRTHQAAQSVRSRRASIVKEVSQKESEQIATRTLTNYNHMHALTVQYYEVVQLNRTVIELSKAERCVFIPMKLLDFTDTRLIDRFKGVIALHGLNSNIRALALGQSGRIAFFAPRRTGNWDAAGIAGLNKLVGEPVGSAGDSVLFFPPEKSLSYGSVFFSKDVPFKDILLTDQAGRTIQVPLAVEDGEGGPLTGSLHHDLSAVSIALKDIRRVEVRKADAKKDYSGITRIGCCCFDESGPFWFHWNVNVPKDSDSVVIFEVRPTIGGKDLIQHLNDNRLYYSQAIWQSLDPATIGMILSRYTWRIGNISKSLIEVIDPRPVSVVANYLVFRLSGDDIDEKYKWLEDKEIKFGSQTEDLVPVPSGGVFAEAVLGRFNSAEKLDITRFWNWQDSPIPIQAPDIAPVQSGSRQSSENLTPGQLGAPVLNIVNPPALPDPQGMSAILTAIQNGNMFRDMSGLAATIGLAQAGLTATQQGASSAASQAGQNAAVAAQLNEKITGMLEQIVASYLTGGKNLVAGGGGGNLASLMGGISGQGAKINHGKDMDKRNMEGDDNQAVTDDSPNATSLDEESQSTEGPNELEAFRSALGLENSSGVSGILGQILSMAKGTVSTSTYKAVSVNISGSPIPDLWAKVAPFSATGKKTGGDKRYKVPLYTMTLMDSEGKIYKTFEVLRFGVRLDVGEPIKKARVQGLTRQYSNHVLTEFDPTYLPPGAWVISHLSKGRAMIHDGNTLETGIGNLGCIEIMKRTKEQHPYQDFLAALLKLTGAKTQDAIANKGRFVFNCEEADIPKLVEWNN